MTIRLTNRWTAINLLLFFTGASGNKQLVLALTIPSMFRMVLNKPQFHYALLSVTGDDTFRDLQDLYID